MAAICRFCLLTARFENGVDVLSIIRKICHTIIPFSVQKNAILSNRGVFLCRFKVQYAEKQPDGNILLKRRLSKK